MQATVVISLDWADQSQEHPRREDLKSLTSEFEPTGGYVMSDGVGGAG